MRFMQAYKRLDALCRDMNGIGVTGYIEDMRKTVNGSLHVSGWNADFQRLKYYRHIRNQIAHEVDVTEEEMYSSANRSVGNALSGFPPTEKHRIFNRKSFQN